MYPNQFPQKILVPDLPTSIVHRDFLMQLLADKFPPMTHQPLQVASCKLILLCAPAGYGKTTLLADTIRQQMIPCCWYFLDRTDTDTATFLRLLLISVQQAIPQLASHIDPLVTEVTTVEGNMPTKLPHYFSVVDALLQALAELPHPVVLALCNYHEVNNNETINRLINHLLLHLPRQCILVIESRAMPHLELAPLIAHSQLLGLGSQGLHFDKKDVLELARVLHVDTMTEEEAERLTIAFDGWITGILLGSWFGQVQFHNPLQTDKRHWGATTIQNSRHQLFNYVVNDIFRYEQDTCTFLKETAILESMTPNQCNALLDITDAKARLVYAEQQGLFVMSRGEENHLVYTCHPMLRNLFLEDLRVSSSERYHHLHRRAAQLLQQNRDYESAYSHAIQANDLELAAQILLEAAPAMIVQGHTDILIRWLHMLPLEVQEAHPHLLLTHVNIYLMRGEYAMAQMLLDKVDTLFNQAAHSNDDELEPRLHAGWLLARSTLLLYQGQYQQAQSLCQQSLEMLPLDERMLRIQGYQRLGICLIVGTGQVHEGIACLQQALQLCGPFTEERQTALLHNQLANAYSWVGNYAISEHHRTRAIRIWERLGQPWGIINNLTGLGQLKTKQGFQEEAEQIFQRALALSHDLKFQSGEAYAMLGFGELALDLEHFGQALAYLEDSLSLARELKDHYLITCGQCALATTYLQMGDPRTAGSLLDQIVLQSDEVHGYESILYMLTRGTISLAIGQFEEAKARLTLAEVAAREAGIQRLQLQSILRLAACLLTQGNLPEAKQQMRYAAELNQKGDHDHCLHIELQHYPYLQQLMDIQHHAKSAKRQEKEVHQTAPTRSIAASEGQRSTQLPGDGNISPSQPSLRILALGEPTVLIDDMPVIHWRMARAMELYYFLLEKGRPLRKEQIIEALWLDSNDQVDQTLRSTFYYLRKAIGEPCVIYRSGLYSLELRQVYGDYWYDVAEFETYWKQAKKLLASGDDSGAASPLSVMTALYRGDYAQSFYSDWCSFRRDELRRTYIEARRHLALIAWRKEQWDESLEHWQRLLALDECMETAHYGVIRCYMRQGKRDLALRQYQRCVQALRDQLKVAPGPSIQKLYQRLLT